ncbi:hypothetical protein V5799_005204 [Amblyomma americanum]|uniref:Apoptosis regulatory protein Siva n=1 Tax=Amblyomma americanum TaxID=6943 RepID=A0AAQ4DZX4_AMBAM
MSAVHSKTLKMLYSGSNPHSGTVKLDRGGQMNGTNPVDLQPKQCGSCHRKCVVVSACAFCDRTSCEACTRLCVSCEKVFCPLCSVLKYNQHEEYAVCLTCGS